ncbi:hypothetical protein GH714_005038 [Hevea brasiliensis]|uniref:Uncharacterized protein n=1 Tax=Hevea brasiliensis TaxID=3981 RepID=A0A6A6M956_HEVBR|nr:hypothetical protein GH714_005038 [Hevea brasiliensis]
MSSPCLSGGSRTYGFDLERVKSPSTSTRTSQSSSPSSTISESSNSPLAITTRKPRTPRKRPNQTYNEAAALLSTAYPNIFSTKHLTKPRKFIKPHQDTLILDESSPELLWPFRVLHDSDFLLHQPIESGKPSIVNESKVANFMISCDNKSCQSGNSKEFCDGYQEDFDAESILDEEIEEGIDGIMGNLRVSNENAEVWSNKDGNPMGFHFGWKFQLGIGNGMRKGVRALRYGDEGNWWNFPIVDMLQISPRLNHNNIKAKLAEIDIFSENGIREASVLRYKEKRLTRLFSKKIRSLDHFWELSVVKPWRLDFDVYKDEIFSTAV